MTWPLTLSSPPLDWNLAKVDVRGLRIVEGREKEDVARGNYNISGTAQW